MERYRLLRNNQESGPFSRPELEAKGLLPSDLIWVDGQSTAWKYPEEIEGLSAMIKKINAESKPVRGTSADTSTPTLQEYRRALAGDSGLRWSDEEKLQPSFTERLIDFETQKKPVGKKLIINPNLFGLAVLFVGVMAGAFILKKMVDTFDEDPAPSSQAVELKEEALPTSTSVHTAQVHTAAMQALIAVAQKDTVQLKPLPPKKTELVLNDIAKAQKSAAKTTVPAEPVKMEASPEDLASTVLSEEKPEAPVPANRASSLQLSTNDFKVGLFGGISGLELTVNNSSSQTIDNAVVEIEFLKPNGNVVKTQMLTVEKIPAGGNKTVAVPASSRGVKVHYRVVSAE